MRKYLLYIIVIALAPSCTVLKCRYSGGWQVGLDRRVEFPAQKQRKITAQTLKEGQKQSDSTAQTILSQFLIDGKIENTSQVLLVSSHLIKQSHLVYKTQMSSNDSAKNRRKRARQLNQYNSKQKTFDWYDWVPDNQSEFVLFLLLLGLILAVLIVWGIFELFRWLIRLIFQEREHFSDNRTLMANAKDSADKKGSEFKISSSDSGEDGLPSSEEVNSSDEQKEEDLSNEDVQNRKDDNKSKLLNFIAVFFIGFVLIGLMALGMRNQ